MQGQRVLIAAISFVLLLTIGSANRLPAADAVVKVGAVQATKGVLSKAFLEINAGLKDSLTIANKEGGVNGKKIQYIMKETHYKVDESKEKFDEIIREHNPLAMFGNSTGLGKAIAEKIKNTYKILYTSTSFSAALADAPMYPSIFVPGPTYGDQMGILLMHIAKTKPKARVALFYSSTAFGKDPIPFARLMAKRLQLKLVSEQVVKLGTKEVANEVVDLKKAAPDFVIFQGFVMEPVPTVIRMCRELGMTCKFMGTFWTANKTVLDLLGPLAEGYMVVNPYAYWSDEKSPMIRKIRAYNAENYPDVTYRYNTYMEGFAAGLLLVETLRRADTAGALNYDGLVKALKTLKNVDTGGLTAPLTIVNNRFPTARVYEADAAKGMYVPRSEWLTLR